MPSSAAQKSRARGNLFYASFLCVRKEHTVQTSVAIKPTFRCREPIADSRSFQFRTHQRLVPWIHSYFFANAGSLVAWRDRAAAPRLSVFHPSPLPL